MTGSGTPEAEKVQDLSLIIRQEELSQMGAEGTAIWFVADQPTESMLSPTGKEEKRKHYSVDGKLLKI